MEEVLRKPDQIIRVTRDVPPAHYMFRIESFSLLADTGVEQYDSHAFEVENYKWRLSLYPNGNKKINGDGFISLYLHIEETENLSRTWELNVSFRFFILDQIRDKYLTIEAPDAERPLRKDLVDDCCTFGVEIFVIKQTGKLERLSMMKQPANNTITFQLQNYSKSYSDYYTSAVQTIGDSKWELMICPGSGAWTNFSTSVNLRLVEANKLPHKGKVYANFKLRIKDPYNRDNINNEELTDSGWFTASDSAHGFRYFIALGDLLDKSKGYIVEAEITIVSKVELFL